MSVSAAAARRIARQVSRDFDLHPPLSAADVRLVLDPAGYDIGAAGLRAYYGDDLAASVESRILQEADFA